MNTPRVKNLGHHEFPRGPKARTDDGGKITLMARSGGYVMVRRPRCFPYVMGERAWVRLADWAPTAAANEGAEPRSQSLLTAENADGSNPLTPTGEK